MSTTKEYFAFISYQRKDEKIADELRHKLEHYHLPSNVRKENPSFPKTIYPIFRDALELSGGVLSEQIEQALEQSKYLIVVCSPNSAKSPWVNKEVQTFIRMGKERKIIPFIIDGEPNSENSETECFPPALRELTGSRELLGININELGREAAAVKVVACMFGLKFDSLWQRFQREQRRKKWIMIGGAVLFALVSLCIGLYIARKNLELESLNMLISEQNNELMSLNENLKTANKKIGLEQDKTNKERVKVKEANDSLENVNLRLVNERNKVLNANKELLNKQSRIISEKVLELLEDSDSYMANLLLLETFSTKNTCIFESEVALRKAAMQNTTTLKGHNDEVIFASYTKDGKEIISVSRDHTTKIWDANTGLLKDTMEGLFVDAYRRTDSKNSSCIPLIGIDYFESYNGRWILRKQREQGKESLKIVDTKFNQEYVADFVTQDISSICFSFDDNYIAVGTHENNIVLIDAHTGRIINSFFSEQKLITSLAFNQSGTYLLSGSYDNKIHLWDIQKGELIKKFEGHSEGINCVSFNNMGNFLLSASGNTVRMWSVKTGEIIKSWEKHLREVRTAFFSPDGKQIISAGRDFSVVIWNVDDEMLVKKIEVKHEEENLQLKDDRWRKCIGFNSIQFHPNGEFYMTSSDDKIIRLWDYKNHSLLKTYKGCNMPIRYVSFILKGEGIMSISEDNHINIWDINTDTIIKTYDFKDKDVWIADITPNCRTMIIYDGKLNLLDLNTGLNRQVDCWLGNVTDIAFNNENQMALSSGLHQITVWNLEKGIMDMRLLGHSNQVLCVEYSPDGKIIASASMDNTIKIWNSKTGTLEATLEGHTNAVSDVSFSSDNKYIVSASWDRTVKVWDYKTYRLLCTYKHENSVHSVVFSPDNKYILSASSDGIVVWDFPSLEELIGGVRERFRSRRLTPEEKQRYYLD